MRMSEGQNGQPVSETVPTGVETGPREGSGRGLLEAHPAWMSRAVQRQSPATARLWAGSGRLPAVGWAPEVGV